MLTKKQALEFLKSREDMHTKCAKKIALENDLIENDVERIKYNTRIELAGKYRDIYEMLKEG